MKKQIKMKVNVFSCGKWSWKLQTLGVFTVDVWAAGAAGGGGGLFKALSLYPKPPTEASGSCLDLATPKPDIPKITDCFWRAGPSNLVHIACRSWLQSPEAELRGLHFTAHKQCWATMYSKIHKLFGCRLRASSNFKPDFKFQCLAGPFATSSIFLFEKYKHLHLFLIPYLSQSCQKINLVCIRQQFTSLGWTSNPTKTVPILCLLPHLQTCPCPGAMEPEAQSALPVINQTRTLTRRQPQPQSQRKELHSSYFIYNLLTTEWKLIEAAGSKWLPVCQHQMAAPALTPLDRSSLTLSSQPRTHRVLWVPTLFPFVPGLRWCSSTTFRWAASDSEKQEHTRTSHIYIFTVHICLLDRYCTFIFYAVPGVHTEHVLTTWYYSEEINAIFKRKGLTYP